MSGGAPVWRRAFDRAERTVGTPLEEAVASRRMSDLFTRLNRQVAALTAEVRGSPPHSRRSGSMAADLAISDVLSGVRREVERNATRARNGIRYVAGAECAPVGPTPSNTVWREGKVEWLTDHSEEAA